MDRARLATSHELPSQFPGDLECVAVLIEPCAGSRVDPRSDNQHVFKASANIVVKERIVVSHLIAKSP